MTDAIANKEFTASGRTFKLTSPAAAYWQVVVEHIRTSRVDPITVAIAASNRTPRDAIAGLFSGAFEMARRRGVVTFTDVSEFEQTPEGLAFRFMLAAAIHHGAEFPEYDAATRFVFALSAADMIMLQAILDEIGR